ncbi:MAG: HEAT repeat domain-containing protein [Candidatus Heimdallarchaeota archaeon]
MDRSGTNCRYINALEDPSSVIQKLREMLKHESWEKRGIAVWILSTIKWKPRYLSLVVLGLLKALNDPNDEVRWRAEEWLENSETLWGQLEDPAPLLTLLRRAIKNENAYIRQKTVEALVDLLSRKNKRFLDISSKRT